MIDVYRGQPWYVARNEPEEEFVGTLEASHPAVGPGSRPSLAFVLRSANDTIPVYAAGVVDLLEPLVGLLLRLQGKFVDLTGEGGTRELWIATIASSRSSCAGR